MEEEYTNASFGYISWPKIPGKYVEGVKQGKWFQHMLLDSSPFLSPLQTAIFAT